MESKNELQTRFYGPETCDPPAHEKVMVVRQKFWSVPGVYKNSKKTKKKQSVRPSARSPSPTSVISHHADRITIFFLEKRDADWPPPVTRVSRARAPDEDDCHDVRRRFWGVPKT